MVTKTLWIHVSRAHRRISFLQYIDWLIIGIFPTYESHVIYNSCGWLALYMPKNNVWRANDSLRGDTQYRGCRRLNTWNPKFDTPNCSHISFLFSIMNTFMKNKLRKKQFLVFQKLLSKYIFWNKITMATKRTTLNQNLI